MAYTYHTCPVCGESVPQPRAHWNKCHKNEYPDFDDFMAMWVGVERETCPHCGKKLVFHGFDKEWICPDKECRAKQFPNHVRPEKECPVCHKKYKRLRDHWRQAHKEQFPSFEDFVVYAFLGPDVKRPVCPYCGTIMHWTFAHDGMWQCGNQECRKENHGRRAMDTCKDKQVGLYTPGNFERAGRISGLKAKAEGTRLFDKERAEKEKWGLRNPEIHRKTIEASKRNGTGVHDPNFYIDHKEIIDASLAKGRETQRLTHDRGIYDPQVRVKARLSSYGNKDKTYFYMVILKDRETGEYYVKPGYSQNPLGRINSYSNDYNNFDVEELYVIEGPASETLLIEQMVHSKFRDYSEDPNKGRSGDWKWLDGQSEYKRINAFKLIRDYVSSNFGKEMRKMELEVS